MSESIALETHQFSAALSSSTNGPRSTVRRLGRLLESTALWIILLAAWFFTATYFPLGENPLVPSPAITAQALWDSLPELWLGTLSSFSILVPGFALATVLGVALGLSVGTSPRLQRSFSPFARVAAPVPPTV